MPVKRRRPKSKLVPLSDLARSFFLDESAPEDETTVEHFTLRFDTGDPQWQGRVLWSIHREELLAEFVKRHPGRRPHCWWRYDAPRATDGSMVEMLVSPSEFLWRLEERPAEPRKRMGGTGDPASKHLNFVPEFELGVPSAWITPDDLEIYTGIPAEAAIDLLDPPRFESQAAYLRRHGQFLPGEDRRLKPEDFQPAIPDEIGDAIHQE